MRQETGIGRETQDNHLPTTLTLSPHISSERERVRRSFSEFEVHGQNVNKIGRSLAKLNAVSAIRLERLKHADKEINHQAYGMLSSITCGEVYLKMLEEKELKHLSAQELMDFFTLCLEANVDINEQIDADIDKKGEDGALASEISYLKASIRSKPKKGIVAPILKVALRQKIGHPPTWFNHNKENWIRFVGYHSLFYPYLNAETVMGIQWDSIMLDRHPTYSKGITIRGEYPDWFLERNGKPPAKEEIEQELEEDQEQFKKIPDQHSKIHRDIQYVNNFSWKKQNAVAARMHELWEKLSGTPRRSLFDPIFYINMIHGIDQTPLEGSSIEIESFDTVLQTVARDFSKSMGIFVAKEPIALFVEKRFRERKIIGSAQEKIDDKFIELFMNLSDDNKLSDLREADRKAFNFLNFDIKPLIEILPPEITSFLLEMLAVSKGEKIESFIWEVADAVSSYFKSDPAKIGTQIAKIPDSVVNGIRSTTEWFLKNHWQWAYEQYRKSALGSEDSLPSAQEPQASIEFNPEEETGEIEERIVELNKGNLAGWSILYAKNKDTQEDHLTEIGGETIEEREAALESFLLRENVASSIKPGSIIRAFEWLVTVPTEVEQIRMRKDVNGEVFRKLKRGKVRIFYVMDDVKKRIIFFLHQKQAMSYGF